jgi:hypothetical protein
MTNKSKARAPLALKKLQRKTVHKTAQVTNTARNGTTSGTDSNTINGTNKCSDHASLVDSSDSDLGLDSLEQLHSSSGTNRLGRAGTLDLQAVFDEFDDEDQLESGVGGAGPGKPLDYSALEQDQLEHVANCLGIDTVGLELAKSFSEKDDDGEDIDGTGWSKSALKTEAGKRSLAVSYVAKTRKLKIEGSNAMRCQGQNVVASGDLPMVAYSMLKAVKHTQDLPWPDFMGHRFAHGVDVEVTRIDVFLLLKVPDGVSKGAFINALAMAGIGAGINTSLYVSESVYFDQSSQLEGQKIYDKEAELNRARKGGLPDTPGIEHVEDIARRYVRVEAVFRTKKLVAIAKKHGGRPHPCLFTKEVLAEMVLTLLKKYATHGNIFRRLNREFLLTIPLPYRSTVAHWQNGEHLPDMVKSERVMKHHKAYLLHHHQISLDGESPDVVRETMSLADVLAPENFMPVPEIVRNNPALFYELNMDEERRKLKSRVGGGIGSIIVYPYGPRD